MRAAFSRYDAVAQNVESAFELRREILIKLLTCLLSCAFDCAAGRLIHNARPSLNNHFLTRAYKAGALLPDARKRSVKLLFGLDPS